MPLPPLSAQATRPPPHSARALHKYLLSHSYLSNASLPRTISAWSWALRDRYDGDPMYKVSCMRESESADYGTREGGRANTLVRDSRTDPTKPLARSPPAHATGRSSCMSVAHYRLQPVSQSVHVRELPDMISAKFLDCLTPSPLARIWI